MFRELYKAIKAVVRVLLLCGPTLIILSETPVVTVSLDLPGTDSNWGGGGGPDLFLFPRHWGEIFQVSKPKKLFLA